MSENTHGFNPENKEAAKEDPLKELFTRFLDPLIRYGDQQELQPVHPNSEERSPYAFHLLLPPDKVEEAFRMSGTDERITAATLAYYEPHITGEGQPITVSELILDIHSVSYDDEAAQSIPKQKLYTLYRLSPDVYDATVSEDAASPDEAELVSGEGEDERLSHMLYSHLARNITAQELTALQQLQQRLTSFYA